MSLFTTRKMNELIDKLIKLAEINEHFIQKNVNTFYDKEMAMFNSYKTLLEELKEHNESKKS